MEAYIIQGGRPLVGEVTLSGAKNLASKLLLATLLTSEECVLENVPEIGENAIAIRMLELVGGHAERSGTTIRVRNRDIQGNDLSAAPKNRLSILAIAPLLLRTGRAVVTRPGGDRIGKRPVDFHLRALEQLGATVREEGEMYVAEARMLHGSAIRLPYPSVGATETVLLAGVWANGTTTLTNAAIEPEIIELVTFLRALGGTIEHPAERTFVIHGTRAFGSATQQVIPDRLEAASYAAAALATRGDVLIRGTDPKHLSTYETFVRDIGGHYEVSSEGVRVAAKGSLCAVDIRTDVYPAFVTDWQQPSAVVLVTAQGRSTIHETVMDDRFGYTADLVQMGADIQVSLECVGEPCRFNGRNRHVAVITGPRRLRGTSLEMPDIRAGMAQTIAALIAEGESQLTGLAHLDRGYGPQLVQKLQGLGAAIERIELPA